MSNTAKDPVWLIVSSNSHIRGDDDEKIRKDMETYSQAKLNDVGRVLRFSSVVGESRCVPHRGKFQRVGDLLYILVDHFDGVPATAMEERYFDSLEKVSINKAHETDQLSVEKPDSAKPDYKGCICGAIAGGGRCTDESCPAYAPWHIPNDGCLEHGLMMSELVMCKGDQHRGFCIQCRICVTCGIPDNGFEVIHADNQLS